ncbi:MAG: hypothetical protein ABSE97_06785 [Verrucomicrobiota bacterium]
MKRGVKIVVLGALASAGFTLKSMQFWTSQETEMILKTMPEQFCKIMLPQPAGGIHENYIGT